MTDPNFEPQASVLLTPAGARRREELLGELHARMRSRTQTRAVLRGTSAVACTVGLCVLAWFSLRSEPTAKPTVGPIIADSAANAEPSVPIAMLPPASMIEFVADDPTVRTRLFVDPHTRSRVQRIDDGTLVAALRAGGREVGLVRLAGKVKFVEPDLHQ